MSVVGLAQLHSAAKAAESAIKLMEKGDLETARRALERAKGQLAGLREPAHSRRQRFGRRMLAEVTELAALAAQEHAPDGDVSRTLWRAKRAVRAALELQPK